MRIAGLKFTWREFFQVMRAVARFMWRLETIGEGVTTVVAVVEGAERRQADLNKT
jgi:hypothetical protein